MSTRRRSSTAPPAVSPPEVVLPLLAPALTVTVTITLIVGLRVFEQVIALTDGGPVERRRPLRRRSTGRRSSGRFGYGGAFALILTPLITVVALTSSRCSGGTRSGSEVGVARYTRSTLLRELALILAAAFYCSPSSC